jgi:hypothetical protein
MPQIWCVSLHQAKGMTEGVRFFIGKSIRRRKYKALIINDLYSSANKFAATFIFMRQINQPLHVNSLDSVQTPCFLYGQFEFVELGAHCEYL